MGNSALFLRTTRDDEVSLIKFKKERFPLTIVVMFSEDDPKIYASQSVCSVKTYST